MTVEQFSVLDVSPAFVRINARQQQHCGQCAMQTGCGHQLFAEFTARKHRDTSLLLPVDQDLSSSLQAGDTLDIRINDASLVNLALLHYFLPIVLMVTGTVAAENLAANFPGATGAGEAWVIVTALVMLAAGMGLVHWLVKRLSPHALMTIQHAQSDLHLHNVSNHSR